jgi:hypothetical protein
MIGLFCFALAVLASPFRSKLRLEAENAVLRHQLIVLRRRPRGRVRLSMLPEERGVMAINEELETLRLLRAFAKIKDRVKRREVIELVEDLAPPEAALDDEQSKLPR